MNETQEQTKQAQMVAAEVVERPFTSPTPLIGPLLARFRSGWNSIATKWYVRPLLAQQNGFNHLVVERFGEQEERFGEQDGRLMAQDRQQTQHSHDLAEIIALLIQIGHRVTDLDRRLTDIEKQMILTQQEPPSNQ